MISDLDRLRDLLGQKSEQYVAERKAHEATRAKLEAAIKIVMSMAAEMWLTPPTDPVQRKRMKDLIIGVLNEPDIRPRDRLDGGPD